jgi:hypothetical protein
MHSNDWQLTTNPWAQVQSKNRHSTHLFFVFVDRKRERWWREFYAVLFGFCHRIFLWLFCRFWDEAGQSQCLEALCHKVVNDDTWVKCILPLQIVAVAVVGSPNPTLKLAIGFGKNTMDVVPEKDLVPDLPEAGLDSK